MFPRAAYARRYMPSSIDPTRFTHLIYAFAKIDKGEVTLGDDAVDTENFAELQALRRRNGRLQIFVAVGGWEGSADFSDVAASDLLRQRFAESAVAFLRMHTFDGIDIDWEHPVVGGKNGNTHRSADKQNFIRLLEALRNALDAAGREDGRRYLLTIAAGASADNTGNLELEATATLVDWIGLMSYDFSGAWSKTTGHNAPLAVDPNDPTPGAALNTVSAAVGRYLTAGVPKRKLLLGFPLYGRAWRGCDSRNKGDRPDLRRAGERGPGKTASSTTRTSRGTTSRTRVSREVSITLSGRPSSSRRPRGASSATTTRSPFAASSHFSRTTSSRAQCSGNSAEIVRAPSSTWFQMNYNDHELCHDEAFGGRA